MSGPRHAFDANGRASAPAVSFTARDRAIVARLDTPAKVQRWLNALPYNSERGGETQRSFRGVVATGKAHCMEAALSAATILEQHGYAPLVMSIESIDLLDHVIFIYRTASGWGSVARSRDPGLHGRKPVFRTPRDLALSYVDAYVDYTGRVRGYGVANLAEAMNGYDWRTSPRNVWKVEQMLIDLPHRRIRTSDARHEHLKRRYATYRARFGRKPIYYDNRRTWMPLPKEFRSNSPLNRDRSP